MPGVDQHRFPSPLRYPGGKGKIANYLKLVFLQNGLTGSEYVEPYAGGASAALTLLYEEYVSCIHINDINRSLHAFWDCVLNDTDSLCRKISRTEVSLTQWCRQRRVQEAAQPDPIDLAFSTFFLNRTNRSGIIWGGVIGGKQQDGPWKLDARYNKQDLIRRIEKVARYRTRIALSRVDAATYIEKVISTLGPRILTYFDPPYYVKGEGLYEHFYQHEDHVRIARLVQALPTPWIVSYDAHPALKRLYDGCEKLAYDLSYSAGDRYRGSEIMFFSSGITRPKVASPARIHASVINAKRLALLKAS